MKKEALEVLKNRRSIRKFQSRQISAEELDTVLEAGTYAPTAGGRQAPVIVAVQDAETVAALDAMNAKVMGNASGASLLRRADHSARDGAGRGRAGGAGLARAIGGNLLNAAYAVGLGSCWIHRSKEMFESEEGKALLKKWGLPETMRGVCSIALGYADCPHPDAAPRKSGYIIKV